jgi:hypothetical protein
MQGVEEGLDAEAVAGREQGPVGCVPEHQGELTAKPVQAVSAEVLVEMEGDLAVGAGAETVPVPLQLVLDDLEPLELAVHDELRPAVLARDRLGAGGAQNPCPSGPR